MQSVQKDVENWLDEVVIGLKLCPFAEYPRHQNRIALCISQAKSIEELLISLVEQAHQLVESSLEELETTLIVAPDLLDNFDDYLDCLALAEQVFESQGWQGILQIASFHPLYQFEGTEPGDIENFTNRSPYPIFHLLREESVSKAVDSFSDVALIPERNKETLANLSLKKQKQLFKHC